MNDTTFYDDRIDKEALAKAIELFLSIPFEKRSETFSALKYNGIFCAECGYGSRERPNQNCQCWNDE